MDEKHLDVVTDYPGLQRAMRARAEALQISRATLDALAGTHDGHAGKMLADPPKKNMGITTMGYLLQALGLKLIVAEDAAQMCRIQSRLVQRDVKNGTVRAVTTHPTIEIRISRRDMKKRQINGGKTRAAKLTPRQRTASARKAARARWHKPKIVEITNPAAPVHSAPAVKGQ